MKIFNKKFLLVLILLLGGVCVINAYYNPTGCTEFVYNKHQYIMFRFGNSHNSVGGVVHNPDCPCFKHNKYGKK